MTRQPSAASVRQSCFPRLRAPPVTSATLPLMPRSTVNARSVRFRSCIPLASPSAAARQATYPLARLALPSLELSRPLLEEGLQSLSGVLGADHLVEGADLHLDGLVDG